MMEATTASAQQYEKHHESVLILSELTAVFTDEKDAQLILDIEEKKRLFKQRHEAKQAEIKEAIKALTADLQRIEVKAQRKEPKERFVAKMNDLTKEEELAKTRLDQMEQQVKKLEDELSRLVIREEELLAKSSGLTRQAEELPRLQYLLGLYQAVSGIKWSMDKDNDQTLVEGRMCYRLDCH